MEAAVKAGCDAVYAGGSLFSARAYAGNLDQEHLLKAIDHCHLFGVKLYMTVNTLLKDTELTGRDGESELVRYMEPYYKAGLDAVLVQDMGVFRILKEAFPDLPLHASTQMSISSVYGARFAKRIGISRIVPSRELSLEEIRSIREKADIEIETFVHGALCFAYSGKCLLSSFAGGRSGNRGRCAQPCRQLYELYDTSEEEGGPSVKEYLMSLKDLCTLQELPKLMDAGIDSFKIEGRMKNPNYVACVVSAYRRARDCYLSLLEKEDASGWEALSAEAKKEYESSCHSDQKDLKDIYNRGGFHTGYYFTDKGKVMSALMRPNHEGLLIGTVKEVSPPKVTIQLSEDIHRQDVVEIRPKVGEDDPLPAGMPVELTSGADAAAGGTISLKGKELRRIRPGMEVWRTKNEKLIREIEEKILREEKTVTADCRIRAKKREPLEICLTAEIENGEAEPVSVCVKDKTVEAAQQAATKEETLVQKMRKSGGSGIAIGRIACEIDADAFVPMSAFNGLRREAADKLKEKLVGRYRR